ncbi:GNAT family N-acetyltransferase [Spirochaeta dissipatitropha]
MIDIIEPVERRFIQRELDASREILNFRGIQVMIIIGDEAPFTLQEIGRIRELEFRKAGAGRNLPVDIDELDRGPVSYRHLIAWDPEHLELIAAYRYMLCGDLDQQQLHYLRTQRLFEYSSEFIEQYLPATIELGRSVVNQSARKSRMGLFCTWAGLAALMSEYRHIKYYFGNVSMYRSYDMEAQSWILEYLQTYHAADTQLIRAWPEYRMQPRKNSSRYLEQLGTDAQREEAWNLLAELLREKQQIIPPILQSYVGACPGMTYLDTAIDNDFGGALEAAILVDRELLNEKTRQRFFDGYQSINPERFRETRWVQT